MRKSIIILTIISTIMLLSFSNVYAATGKVTLKSSSSEVKPGDTFTVTISASCDSGINGIDTKFTYDTDKLEMESSMLSDSRFASLGSDQDITIISNTTDKITSADIWKIVFKVKSTAKSGDSAKITMQDGTMDSDDENNSNMTISGTSLSVKVGSSGSSGSNSDSNNNEENKTIPSSGEKQPDTTSDSKASSQTSQVSAAEKDATTSSGKLPQTGATPVMLIIVLAVVVLGVIFFIKSKKTRIK